MIHIVKPGEPNWKEKQDTNQTPSIAAGMPNRRGARTAAACLLCRQKKVCILDNCPTLEKSFTDLTSSWDVIQSSLRVETVWQRGLSAGKALLCTGQGNPLTCYANNWSILLILTVDVQDQLIIESRNWSWKTKHFVNNGPVGVLPLKIGLNHDPEQNPLHKHQ